MPHEIFRELSLVNFGICVYLNITKGFFNAESLAYLGLGFLLYVVSLISAAMSSKMVTDNKFDLDEVQIELNVDVPLEYFEKYKGQQEALKHQVSNEALRFCSLLENDQEEEERRGLLGSMLFKHSLYCEYKNH